MKRRTLLAAALGSAFAPLLPAAPVSNVAAGSLPLAALKKAVGYTSYGSYVILCHPSVLADLRQIELWAEREAVR